MLSQVNASAPMSFLQILQLIYAYQEIHLETEQHAGFSEAAVSCIEERFKRYDMDARGLKTVKLWDALEDCGIQLDTHEEQQWMLSMLMKVDKDGNGAIDLEEFCQLLRKHQARMEMSARERENELIMQSQIPLREVEEWFQMFVRYDGDRQNLLSLTKLRGLFASIGIKWGTDGERTLFRWIKQTYGRHDGCLDFGQFCCLIRKLVDEDFHGISSATDGISRNGAAMNTKCDKVRWSEQSCMKLSWNGRAHHLPSPTTERRQSSELLDTCVEPAGLMARRVSLDLPQRNASVEAAALGGS